MLGSIVYCFSALPIPMVTTFFIFSRIQAQLRL
jgi:hypothetical protein